MAGRFIVLEGIDSEVLTAQAGDLTAWLQGEGLRVHLTRQPTDGPFGAQLRLVLGQRLKVDPWTKAALFMTDRMDHLYRTAGILEDLGKGIYVVCVRYVLSTYAYQGLELQQASSQIPRPIEALEWLRQINQLCPWPDLMVFIDTPPEGCMLAGMKRGAQTAQAPELLARYTQEQQAFYRAIECCRAWGQPVQVVDGNQPSATIQRLCRQWVEQLGIEK